MPVIYRILSLAYDVTTQISTPCSLRVLDKNAAEFSKLHFHIITLDEKPEQEPTIYLKGQAVFKYFSSHRLLYAYLGDSDLAGLHCYL